MTTTDPHLGLVRDDPPTAVVESLAIVAAAAVGSALGIGVATHAMLWLTVFTAPAGLIAAGFLLWMDRDIHQSRPPALLPCVAALVVGLLLGIVGLTASGGLTALANWGPLAAVACLGWPATRNGFDPGPR